MGFCIQHDLLLEPAGARPVQGFVKWVGNPRGNSQLGGDQGQTGGRCLAPEGGRSGHLWAGDATAGEPFPGRLRLTCRTREDAMNNSSMFTADRSTHLKIVVVSLLCATIVAGVGIAARVTDASPDRMEASVVKAGKPVTASTTPDTSIR